jgi:hypothetical protein
MSEEKTASDPERFSWSGDDVLGLRFLEDGEEHPEKPAEPLEK